jgi:TonB family protein
MKLHILPLVALSLLLGACNTTHTTARANVPPPVRAENKVTAFGEFPSYDPRGQHFKLYTQLREYEVGRKGRAVVDVIVNADGTVQDAVIFQSSGDDDYDQTALRLFKNSRYSLRLAPGDPAPYVVRQEFATNAIVSVLPVSGGPTYVDTSSKYSDVTPMGQGAKHWTDK